MTLSAGGKLSAIIGPLPVEPGPRMVTIYDILRRLVSPEPWTENERREAAALITELERLNVLGNVAATTTMKGEQ